MREGRAVTCFSFSTLHACDIHSHGSFVSKKWPPARSEAFPDEPAELSGTMYSSEHGTRRCSVLGRSKMLQRWSGFFVGSTAESTSDELVSCINTSYIDSLKTFSACASWRPVDKDMHSVLYFVMVIGIRAPLATPIFLSLCSID